MTTASMGEFLSKEWFADLATRLAALDVSTEYGASLALGQIVTDAPGGTVAWTVHLGGGAPARVEEGTDGADVLLVEDYETALELVSGTPTADLLYAGRVKLRGNVSALLEGAGLLALLSEAIGPAT